MSAAHSSAAKVGPQPVNRDQGDLFALLMLAAAGFLGYALQLRDGLFDPPAFVWLTLAIICALLAHIAPHPRTMPAGSIHIATIIVALIIAFQFHQLITGPLPGSWHGPQPTRVYRAGMITAALFAALALFHPLLTRRVWFPALLATFLLLGIWIIRQVPSPHMDAWEAQQEGLRAFFARKNPYTSTFRDIYNNPDAYTPGTVVDGRVHLGFPYPPLTFLLDLPAFFLCGEYRYSNLIEILASAALIAYARPGRFGALAATVFLFTPRVLFVLESGWTEPTITLMLSLLVFLSLRNSRFASAVLGLFLAGKQYTMFAIAPVLLLFPRPWSLRTLLRPALLALAAGLIVSLPLILWSPRAFWNSNFGQPLFLKPRLDALSYLALVHSRTGWYPPGWIGFMVAAAATVLVMARSRRSASGYAGAIALIYLVFFAFSQLAFCNYYYFVICAMCCAAGAANVTCMEMPQSPLLPPPGQPLPDRYRTAGAQGGR